jgi:ribonuclease VapC
LIVVDSSAVLAIYFDEPDSGKFIHAIIEADAARIGSPNFLEVSMVAEGHNGEAGCRDVDRLINEMNIQIADFGAAHIEAARQAFRKFGKGRHRAALNFGDCCAYGLARTLGAPLLFKGNDFALTDIERAL